MERVWVRIGKGVRTQLCLSTRLACAQRVCGCRPWSVCSRDAFPIENLMRHLVHTSQTLLHRGWHGPSHWRENRWHGKSRINHFFKKFIYLFILFLAALCLHCCARAFSSCSKQGLLFVAVRGLLTAVASLVAWALERRLSSCGARA